ncbi:MAG: hypothetical protein H7Z10_05395 [Gemmatimonadaceae bacterium]|nr:hypothetical protein [Acetobacteraceae bacterium]
MDRNILMIPLVGAGSAFGATGVVLALMGIGVPFLAAALGASAGAGLVLWAVSAGTKHGSGPAHHDAVNAQMAALRHDLRGALSPALMVSDRLVANPDPAVSKAGAAVVRSIEKATALLAASNSRTASSD